MKMFDLDFGTVVIRFYFLMALIIVGVLSGYWIAAIILAFPLFLSIMMGVSLGKGK